LVKVYRNWLEAIGQDEAATEGADGAWVRKADSGVGWIMSWLTSILERGQRLICGDEFCAERLHFALGSLIVFCLQGFDRVADYRDAAAALEQSFGGEAYAVFGDDAEDYEFNISGEAFYQFVRVQALKNVEGLFLEQDLPIVREILRQRCGGFVGNANNFFCQRVGNESGAGSSLHTVGRENPELGIVRRMIAAVGDEKNFALASGVGKTADVRQEALSAGDIKRAAGQHEVGLGVDFPEDYVARYHLAGPVSRGLVKVITFLVE
jgi:hypothetical protein